MSGARNQPDPTGVSRFNAGQKHQLKNVLGEHYAALLPLLEDARQSLEIKLQRIRESLESR